MNLPAIAAQTFRAFSNIPEFWKITEGMMKKLDSLKSPSQRAQRIHKEVSKEISKLFEKKIVKNSVTCKKGCNACCHTQVSVTEDEAILLAEKIRNRKVKIDFNKLKLQSACKDNYELWYQLSYKERSCVFLNEKGECSIYNDRPSVCRTNHVLSDPRNCSTFNGIEKPVRLLSTHRADMLIMAHFLFSDINGTLPNLLDKALDKIHFKRRKSEIFERTNDL